MSSGDNEKPPSFDSSQTDGPTLVNPGRASFHPHLPEDDDRYKRRRDLGRGGMGVVKLCHDKAIGRDVAMKVIRSDMTKSKEAVARFLREARVQGQLEHPSIVPVYDVGADSSGAMFFTMKWLRGATLSHVLRSLAEGDPEIGRTYSRRRLLTAFSSLCQSLEYAHSRGVLHRDIKPSNIMLGDFGEVYLLDWGIAKIKDTDDPASAIELANELDNVRTVAGDILGTPGYIAPEQARGKVSQLDERTEVYALGCILFEMLALSPLHPRGDRFEVLQSTIRGSDARPSARAPDRDIPPELDEICVKATQPEQEDRYPTVRALHAAVESFLDGDRNMEMRRDLAEKHAIKAIDSVERAINDAGPLAEQSRRTALREVGRALALDPDNEQALSALEKVFTAPPREIPADVTAELKKAEGDRHRLQIRDAIWADLSGMGCALPFALWMGIRSWTFVIGIVTLTAISIALKLLAYRKARETSIETIGYLAFVFNALAVAMLSRAWGPLFMMPMLLLVFANGYATTPAAAHQRRVLATTLVIQIGAVLIEALGLLPRSYAFAGGAMTILPQGVAHSETATLVGLTAFTLFTIVVPMRLSFRLQNVLREAEERALVHAWQLKQLLPQRAQTVPPPAMTAR